tara:strand:- start:475 stop:945 length:471 start_codon:yes stop_codon:yes gene_type:complete
MAQYNFSSEAIKEHIESVYKDWFVAAFVKQNKLISDSVEEMYANYVDGVVINATGFDVLVDGERHELKYTYKLQGKSTLRVGGLKSKPGKCDFIVIIDGLNNRTFKIPADIFFDKEKYDERFNVGVNVEFRWSGSYNEKDKVQIENTNLLLKYEEV